VKALFGGEGVCDRNVERPRRGVTRTCLPRSRVDLGACGWYWKIKFKIFEGDLETTQLRIRERPNLGGGWHKGQKKTRIDKSTLVRFLQWFSLR